MSPARIANLVDRGLEIRAQIAALEAEQSKVEEDLRQAGLTGEQVPLEDDESEGRQFLARGLRLVVPIVFTSDLLVKSFAEDAPVHRKIAESLGETPISRFFTRTVSHKTAIDDARLFRRTAREELGPKAPAFLAACVQRDKHGIPRNQIRIAWDRAKPVA